MAQTAALQLGNIISSKISGTLGSFASGIKGSFIGANPAVFGPMVGTMGKMFSTQARAQKEAEQRRQGFEEERVNEQNKMFNDILSVMKGVASSLEAIQKDVRAILDILKEKGFLDKLGDFLKGLLASIPAGLGKLLDGIIDFLKAIPSRLGSVFDSIIDFLKAVPGKIADAFGGVIKFLSELPDKIMNMLTGAIDFLKAIPEKIGTLFSRIVGIFEDFINKYFPKTRDAIVKFFSGLADLLKLDKIKDFFSAIGTKFNNFIKLLDESEIGKAFRKIRNVFAISFAQYADELSDLFTNRIPQIFGNIKTAIGELGNRIMTSFDEAIDLFKTSRVAQLGDELGGRISGAFGAVIDYIKSTKIGSIGADLGGIITSLFDDVKGLFKLPDVSNLGLFFDLGKSAQTFEEFKYVLGEGGVVEKGIATIGKFIGDIGRFFGGAFTTVTEVGSKVADLLAGPLKFFGELTDLAPMFRALGSLGKILGPLGVIFSVIDGLVAAFDTETLAKTLGKAAGDVTWKDRVAGFFGGVIGGVFGLFDLIVDLMGLEKGEESLQSKVTALMTKGIRDIMATFGNIIDLIIGVITFNPTKIADASQNLFDTVKNSFKALANVFIDGINWLIDKLPSWMQPEKLARLDSAESAVAPAAAPAASSANQTEATMARLGIKPNESAGGGRGSSQGSRGYTAGDLKSMGLNVRSYGDVQKPGGYIAGSTIEGAKKTQNLVPGITFTGFNDDYHDQHSPKSSHTKGLAFDFTIPPKAAMDNEFRKDIAQAISSATGAKVIDEYAFPSAKSTGGHFHVDFAGSKGVDLGTGYYRGEKTTNVTPPQPKGTEQPSSGGVDWANAPSESAMDRRLLGGGAPQIGTPPAPAQPQYTVVTRQKILTPEEALAYSQAIAYYDAEKKRYDEEKKYRDERAQLENKFYGDLESMVRPMVTALQGPAGSMDPALARDAGKNLARGMQEDFTRIGTALFGKQYGAAMGTTFQQLAGSYLDQFINQALAPAMGVDAEVLNRSINLYAKGKEFASKTLAPAQKALDDARAALQEKEKASGLTQASIIRASGLGKKLTPEQLAKMSELETMRKGVKEQESKVDALKKQRRQYNQVALEDLFFGMTGVPTGARSLIEQYGGADALTRDLATMIGAPFSPAFHLGEKGPLAGPGVDPRIALDQRLKQTEQVLVEGGQVVAVKTVEGHKDGAVIVYDRVLEGHRAGAAILSDAITNSRVNLGSVTGSSMDVFTSAIGDGVKSAIGEIDPTFMGFDEVAGGGTSIPGYVDDGSYDRAEMAKFGRQTSAMGPSSTARLPVNTGKLMDFGQNMLYNALGSKVSSMFGGGMTGNIFGRAATGALKGAFSGGDIVQNIGAQFGMKLAPGAGIGDLLGGVSSMFTNQITSMGSMFTNLATSKLMPGFMSQGVMDFGTGIQAAGGGLSGLTGAFGSGNLSHMAGAAAGGLMAGMQGYGISKALSGGYSTGGNTVNLLAGIGSAFFGPIAGVVGGLVNRAFGMKAKETKAQGFSGTFSTEGANVQQFSDWFQKGGWFRSDKRGTELKAVDTETANAFTDVLKDTTKTIQSLAKVLGFDPTRTKGYSKAVRIDLKGLNEKEQQEAIEKAFKEYGSGLIESSFGAIKQFTKTGEDQLDALSRMANASQIFKSTMTGINVEKILGIDVLSTPDLLNKTVSNVFTKLNLDPVGDLAQRLVASFTDALKDNAGALQNFLRTYVADFQSELIKAYGGEEEFRRVETSLFDLMYTESEKVSKLQTLSAVQMKDAAEALKDAGYAIDPEKLNDSFEVNQKTTQDMLEIAEIDLSLGKITKEQFANIRKSARDFLDAAKKNSELSKAAGTTGSVTPGAPGFKPMTAQDAVKLIFPPSALVPLQDAVTQVANQAQTAIESITTATTAGTSAIATALSNTLNLGSKFTTLAAENLRSLISEKQATLKEAIEKGVVKLKDQSPGAAEALIEKIAAGEMTITEAFKTGVLLISKSTALSVESIITEVQKGTTSLRTAFDTGVLKMSSSTDKTSQSLLDEIKDGKITLEKAISSGLVKVTDTNQEALNILLENVTSGTTTLRKEFTKGTLSISTSSTMSVDDLLNQISSGQITVQQAIDSGVVKLNTASTTAAQSLINQIASGQVTLGQLVNDKIITLNTTAGDNVKTITDKITAGEITLKDAFDKGVISITGTTSTSASEITSAAETLLSRLIGNFVTSSETFTSAVDKLISAISGAKVPATDTGTPAGTGTPADTGTPAGTGTPATPELGLGQDARTTTTGTGTQSGAGSFYGITTSSTLGEKVAAVRGLLVNKSEAEVREMAEKFFGKIPDEHWNSLMNEVRRVGGGALLDSNNTNPGDGGSTGIGDSGSTGGVGAAGMGDAAAASADSAGAAADGGSSAGDGSGVGDGTGGVYAKGGWFRKKRPMIVGEVGPEVMFPNFAGTIVPTHKIIEAVQNASALDSQTRNLLLNASPSPNPVQQVYLNLERENSMLNGERSSPNVSNAVVDNSVTQVSSPQTTVINGGGDVRSTHPISGMFTRNMIGARGF